MKKTSGWSRKGFLILLILLCLGYAALLHLHVHLTRTHQIDGIFGVLLGLYSAAQPAANILDLLLYGRYESVRDSYRQAGRIFWILNLLVFFASWVVISASLLRYSRLN
ncbi:MAG: hypothetical protein IH586_09300 [Anaerolineaceae bacterium]|nr:hypothetical protein [Anaerolineaceae bacterium]